MDGVRGFEGVLYADGVSVTSTPDRSVFTFLYDDFVVEWTGSEAAGEAPKTGSRSTALAVAKGPGEAAVAVDLGGFRFGAFPAEARLTLRIAGRSFAIPLPPSEEGVGIYERFEVQPEEGADVIGLEVEVSLPQPDPAGRQASVGVDTLSVSFGTSGDPPPSV